MVVKAELECDVIYQMFPQNICNEYGMSTEGAYSPGHLVLSLFEPNMCSIIESNLFQILSSGHSSALLLFFVLTSMWTFEKL